MNTALSLQEGITVIHQSANDSLAVPFTYTILDILSKIDMAAGIAFSAACRESDSVVNWSFSPRHSTEWLKQDPAKAVVLLGSLPPGGFRDHSLCGAVAALAQKDFAAALAVHRKFSGIQPGHHSEDPRTAFYQQWAREDIEGFTKYVNEEATGKLRLAMKEALANALGEKVR